MEQINPTSQKYLYNMQIMGFEHSDRDGEKFAICKRPDGQKSVYVVPDGTGANRPYYFGDFDYFAVVTSCDAAGISCKYGTNGSPIWPSWYVDCNSKEGLKSWDAFISRFHDLVNKYDVSALTTCPPAKN